MSAALTQYVDVAQVVLYAFWIFLAGIIVYLHREDKREGYPLQGKGTKPGTTITVQGFPVVPPAKTFLLADGSSVDDVLKLAGGPTRGADSASLFVIRANGTVVSARQSSDDPHASRTE